MEKTILSLIYLLSVAFAFGQQKAMLVADKFVSDCSFALERTAAAPQTFPAKVRYLREIVLSEDGSADPRARVSVLEHEKTHPRYSVSPAAAFRKHPSPSAGVRRAGGRHNSEIIIWKHINNLQ